MWSHKSSISIKGLRSRYNIPAVFISTSMVPFTVLDVEIDRAYKGYELALFYDANSILMHASLSLLSLRHRSLACLLQ